MHVVHLNCLFRVLLIPAYIYIYIFPIIILLIQYGIFEVPDVNMDNIGGDIEEDDDDEDLEAELAALAAGNDTGYKSRRSGKLLLNCTLTKICICVKQEITL